MAGSFESAKFVDTAAALLGLTIAPEYRPGVVVNFERIAAMAQMVLEFELDEKDEPAPVFRP